MNMIPRWGFLVIMMTCLIGCISTPSGRGIQFIESMSESDFHFEMEQSKLIITTTVQVAKLNDDQKFGVELAASAIRSITEKGISVSITDTILEQYPNMDPVVLNIIHLIENQIRYYGGLPSIDLPLSERSKMMLSALADGLLDGIK